MAGLERVSFCPSCGCQATGRVIIHSLFKGYSMSHEKLYDRELWTSEKEKRMNPVTLIFLSLGSLVLFAWLLQILRGIV
jgi:hypothetical protein